MEAEVKSAAVLEVVIHNVDRVGVMHKIELEAVIHMAVREVVESYMRNEVFLCSVVAAEKPGLLNAQAEEAVSLRDSEVAGHVRGRYMPQQQDQCQRLHQLVVVFSLCACELLAQEALRDYMRVA